MDFTHLAILGTLIDCVVTKRASTHNTATAGARGQTAVGTVGRYLLRSRQRESKMIRCRCLQAGVSRRYARRLLSSYCGTILKISPLNSSSTGNSSVIWICTWHQRIGHGHMHPLHAPLSPPFVNFVTISSSPPRARLSLLPLPLNCLSVLFEEVRPRPGRCHNGCRLRERSERVHRQWRRWRRRRRRRRRRGRLARDSDDGAP